MHILLIEFTIIARFLQQVAKPDILVDGRRYLAAITKSSLPVSHGSSRDGIALASPMPPARYRGRSLCARMRLVSSASADAWADFCHGLRARFISMLAFAMVFRLSLYDMISFAAMISTVAPIEQPLFGDLTRHSIGISRSVEPAPGMILSAAVDE